MELDIEQLDLDKEVENEELRKVIELFNIFSNVDQLKNKNHDGKDRIVKGILEESLKNISEIHVNYLYEDKTLLHIAVTKGFLETTEFLLSKGADWKIEDDEGLTPVHIAAQFHETAMFELFKRYNVNFNIITKDGNTPLHIAVLNRNLSAINTLLEYKVDLQIKNKQGHTPIQLAATINDDSVLEIFKNNEADIHLVNDKGQKLLHIAEEVGNYKMIAKAPKLLFDVGIDESEIKSLSFLAASKYFAHQDNDEYSVGDYLITTTKTTIIDPNYLEAVNIAILMSDTTLNFVRNRVSSGNDPVLHQLIQKKEYQLCILILGNCANPSEYILIKDSKGKNLLDYMAQLETKDEAKDLIDKIITNVEITEEIYRSTPILHRIIDYGKYEILQYFMQKYPKLLKSILVMTDDEGNLSIHHCVLKEDVVAAKTILDAHKQHSVGITWSNRTFNTPSALAYRSTNLELKELFSEIINSPNPNTEDTELHFAILAKDTLFLEYLLKNKAKLNVANRDGETVLSYAAKLCDDEITDIFVKHLASLKPEETLVTAVHVNLKNKKGNNALHYAALAGNVNFFKFLLDIRADLTMTNGVWHTPLHLAAQSNSSESYLIIKLIIDRFVYFGLERAEIAKKMRSFIDNIMLTIDSCFQDLTKGTNNGLLAIENQKLPEISSDISNINGLFKFLEDDIEKYRSKILAGMINQCHEKKQNVQEYYKEYKDSIKPLLMKEVNSVCEQFSAIRESYLIHYINTVTSDNKTALYYSVISCNLESVMQLLPFEINLDRRYENGSSIFHVALLQGKKAEKIILYMIRFASNEKEYVNDGTKLKLLNCKDNDGNTLLHIAVKNNLNNIVALLLECGANPKIRNNAGDMSYNDKAEVNTSVYELTSNALIMRSLIQKEQEEFKLHRYVADLNLSISEVKIKADIQEIINTFDIDSKDTFGNTALHIAVEEGKYSAVKILLELNANCNIKNSVGFSPLHIAARCKHIRLIELLINKGSNKDLTDNQGDIALFHALPQKDEGLSDGTLGEIIFKIPYYFNMSNFKIFDVRNNQQQTILHIIAMRGCGKFVEYLSPSEIVKSINEIDSFSYTALHYAAMKGYRDAFFKLLEYKPNMEIRGGELGVLALHYVIQKNDFTLADIAMIVERMSMNEIEMPDKEGNTITHYLVKYRQWKKPSDISKLTGIPIAIIQTQFGQFNKEHLTPYYYWLEKNISDVDSKFSSAINAVDNVTGNTLLHFLSLDSEKTDQALKLLKMYNIKLDIVNLGGLMPLHCAIKSQQSVLSKAIIEKLRKNKGYELLINAKDIDDNTPLAYAVMYQVFDIALMLLNDKKVSTNFVNRKGKNILHLIADANDKELNNIFIENKKLIADINLYFNKDYLGNTPLHYACLSKNHIFAGFLIKKYQDRSMPLTIINSEGMTFIHCVVKFDSLSILSDILNALIAVTTKKSLLNSRDNQGKTALHIAANKRNYQIIDILIKNGANVNELDDDGKPVIYYAIVNKDYDLVKHLLEYEVDLSKEYEFKQTIFEVVDGKEISKEIVLKQSLEEQVNAFMLETSEEYK